MGIPLASVLGSPISGIILDHAHWFGLSSWRWLLILEGLPAVTCAYLAKLLCCRAGRRGEVSQRWKKRHGSLTNWSRKTRQKMAEAQSMSVVRTLINRRVWHLACIGFAHGFGGYTLSFWLPQMMKSVLGGQSNTVVGLVVMIPSLARPDRDDPRVSPLRPHAGAAIPHGNVGRISWHRFAVARRASLTVPLCCSFFGRGHRGIQLFACFLFDPGEFLSGFSAAAGIALVTSVANLGGFARALHGGPHSAKNWEFVLRLDLCRSFLPCLGELGTGIAQASSACS